MKAHICGLRSPKALPHPGRASRPGPVAEEGVIIDQHLAIHGQQLVVAGDHQRVDLRQGGIAVLVSLPQAAAIWPNSAPVFARQVDPSGDIARLVIAQPEQRIDVHFDDLFRGFAGDFLDLHSAGGEAIITGLRAARSLVIPR